MTAENGQDGPRRAGRVKFFNLTRGYGFITPDDGGADVFVHVTAVNRAGVVALDSGARVSFVTRQAPNGRGVQAAELQLLDDPDDPPPSEDA